jgi:hypothetical protein
MSSLEHNLNRNTLKKNLVSSSGGLTWDKRGVCPLVLVVCESIGSFYQKIHFLLWLLKNLLPEFQSKSDTD